MRVNREETDQTHQNDEEMEIHRKQGFPKDYSSCISALYTLRLKVICLGSFTIDNR